MLPLYPYARRPCSGGNSDLTVVAGDYVHSLVLPETLPIKIVEYPGKRAGFLSSTSYRRNPSDVAEDALFNY